MGHSEIELVIVDLALGGDGIARLGDDGARQGGRGKVVFVAGALPGERVRARWIEQRRDYGRAEVVRILSPSPDRVAPPCPIASDCGGCGWLHLAPVAQRRWKERLLAGALSRLGHRLGVELPAPGPIAHGAPLGVRHRARLHLRVGQSGLVLGFRRARSKEIVDVTSCPAMLPALDAALPQLRQGLAGLRPGAGGSAVLACGEAGEAVVSVRIDTPGERAEALALALVQAGLDGARVSAGAGAAELGALEVRWTWPGPSAPASVAYPAGAFSQSNPEVTAVLVRDAVEAVQRRSARRVLELFAGSGTFTLPLTQAEVEVTAVEGDPDAARALSRALAAAHRGGAEAVCADLSTAGTLDALLVDRTPDVVVVDPPREGARAAFEAIARSEVPAVVMVSCDLATGLRDLEILLRAGFSLEEVRLYDMFPGTPHFETLSVAVRPESQPAGTG
jgi:23S rRNA (uracil1939-C5)-methyltransferase